jgi:hypothetical protein
VLEEIGGGEDVAPGDFTAVSDDHADNAFVFKATGFASEAALDFFDKRVDVAADALRFVVELVVRLGRRFRPERAFNFLCGNARQGLGRRHSRTGASASAGTGAGNFDGGSCAGADGVPDVGLFLVDGGLFAHAGMDDGVGGGEICAGRPAAVLDAEDIERKRLGAGGNDAVLADDAVLFAAADEFAGEK